MAKIAQIHNLEAIFSSSGGDALGNPSIKVSVFMAKKLKKNAQLRVRFFKIFRGGMPPDPPSMTVFSFYNKSSSKMNN